MWSRSNRPAASAMPPRRAVPRRHPPPGAQPVVLVLQHIEARHHARSGNRGRARRCSGRLAATSDVILETFRPGFLASLGLDYASLRERNPRLIMCSLTPFGQTGPWRDYLSTDLLHMAAGGEMASSGYDEADVPNAPPIAPGGGNAWHMGCHFAYHGDHGRAGPPHRLRVGAVYRRVDTRGLRADDRGGDRQLRLPGRGAATPDRSPSCRRARRRVPSSAPRTARMSARWWEAG